MSFFSGDKRYYSTRKVGDVPIIVRGKRLNSKFYQK